MHCCSLSLGSCHQHRENSICSFKATKQIGDDCFETMAFVLLHQVNCIWQDSVSSHMTTSARIVENNPPLRVNCLKGLAALSSSRSLPHHIPGGGLRESGCWIEALWKIREIDEIPEMKVDACFVLCSYWQATTFGNMLS